MKKLHPSPSTSFMFSHPAHFLSLGFGSGLLNFMPGTWGTIFGWLSFQLLSQIITYPTLMLISTIGFIVGIFLTHFTSHCLGIPDPKSVTLDEIIAIWLIFSITMPISFLQQAIIVALFRLFDITKPQPIKYIDHRLKNGLGIMLDDLIAAIYTLLTWNFFELISS